MDLNINEYYFTSDANVILDDKTHPLSNRLYASKMKSNYCDFVIISSRCSIEEDTISKEKDQSTTLRFRVINESSSPLVLSPFPH